MPRSRADAIAALQRDFDVACAHFRMSPEARKIAWRAAMRHVEHASACYRAIANSLGPFNLCAAKPLRSGRRRRLGVQA